MRLQPALFIGVTALLAVVCAFVVADRIPFAAGGPEQPQPVTLKLSTWQPVSRKVLDAFHAKYPYITVEHEQIDSQYYTDIIQTRMVSKEDMDIVWLYPDMLNQYSKIGALTNYSGKSWLANFEPEAVNLGTVYGQVLGIPYNEYVSVIFYNKSLFAQYGVPVPHDWEQLMAACELFQRNGVAPFVLGGKDAWSLQYLVAPRLSLLERMHPDIIRKLRTGEKKWTEPEFRGLFEPMNQVVEREYVLKGTAGLGYKQIAALFKDGKAAMWPMGSWALDEFPDDFSSFPLGIFPVPVNHTGEEEIVERTSNNYLAGITWSKHPEEIEKFMAFLSEPEVAKLYAEETKAAVNVRGAARRLPLQGEAELQRAVSVQRVKLSKSIEKTYLLELQQIVMGERVSEETILRKLQAAQEKDNNEEY